MRTMKPFDQTSERKAVGICEHCGDTFFYLSWTPYAPQKNYCSNKCKHEAMEELRNDGWPNGNTEDWCKRFEDGMLLLSDEFRDYGEVNEFPDF